MAVTVVTTETFKALVLESPLPVIIDFWAEWCGPCRSISPAMEAMSARRTDVRVCKVNVDEEPALAQAFRVQSIPLVVGMKGHTVVAADVGWKGPAALEDLANRTVAAEVQAEAAPAEKREVDVIALKAALEAGATVVDVRNPDEHLGGHVPGAILLPLPELEARVGELASHKGKDLYIICRSGARSARAAEFLATHGHRPINVAGGTMAWIAQGHGVHTPS